MTEIQYALGKIAEEAAEVAQIALKAQKLGLDSSKPGTGKSNKMRIAEEIMDFMTAMHELDLLIDNGIMNNLETFSKEPFEKRYKETLELAKKRGFVE